MIHSVHRSRLTSSATARPDHAHLVEPLQSRTRAGHSRALCFTDTRPSYCRADLPSSRCCVPLTRISRGPSISCVPPRLCLLLVSSAVPAVAVDRGDMRGPVGSRRGSVRLAGRSARRCREARPRADAAPRVAGRRQCWRRAVHANEPGPLPRIGGGEQLRDRHRGRGVSVVALSGRRCRPGPARQRTGTEGAAGGGQRNRAAPPRAPDHGPEFR